MIEVVVELLLGSGVMAAVVLVDVLLLRVRREGWNGTPTYTIALGRLILWQAKAEEYDDEPPWAPFRVTRWSRSITVGGTISRLGHDTRQGLVIARWQRVARRLRRPSLRSTIALHVCARMATNEPARGCYRRALIRQAEAASASAVGHSISHCL